MKLINDLEEKSKWVRKETIRIHRFAPETRLASSLSPIEIFVVLYYGNILKYFSNDPYNDDRDRFVISKGHGSISMYPILADLGFFPKDELNKICKSEGILGGIPDPIIPGYETINGSLGHGLGVAAGMSMALKKNKNSSNVFVMTGDGEMHEGSNWEAVMFSSQHKLDNLHLIIDNNKISMLDYTENIITQNNMLDRLISFGWDVCEVDGHNVTEIHEALVEKTNTQNLKPKAIIANTIKGNGVPGLENNPLSHVVNPKRDILDKLLGEVGDS